MSYAFDSYHADKTPSTGAVSASYLYNGFGQRVSKVTPLVPTGRTVYAYDEEGRVIGEYYGDGQVQQETVYLGNLPVAVLRPGTGTTDALAQVFYVYLDHINTPRVITSAATGNIVWRWDSTDPFGLGQANENSGAEGAFVYDLRFAGQIFDRETSNHYNYYRDYDPQTGRYVQSDLIGLSGGINTYAYVGGNPVSRIDPLGLRDVIVAIWTSQILNGSVGHVFVGEMNGTAITSQFPSPHGIEGANTTKTWIDTVAAEGRSPDSVYQVTVPNDSAFDAAAAAARSAPRWSAFPNGETSTHCASAAASALKAGGVGGISSSSSVWPNWMNTDLKIGSWLGNQVTKLLAAPW